MTEQVDSADENQFSPQEMRRWLEIEIKQIELASRRRIEEASTIVNDYEAGRLTRTEANRRLEDHEAQWGEVAEDLAIASEIHDEAVNTVYDFKHRSTSRRGQDDKAR
jgi:hypothetical protein